MPRKDDYDDRDDDIRPALGPMDKFFRDTNMVLLILLGCCCWPIGLILSIVELATGKDPKGKSNATIVAVIGGVLLVINIISFIVQVAMGPQGGGRGF
jgi:hypothetical protein